MRPERLLAATLLLLLAGCGFQLRGSAAWPETLSPLALGGPELRLDLARELRPALARAGARVVDGGGSATALLEVVAFDEARRLLASAAGSDLREYQLTLSLRYRLLRDGQQAAAGALAASRDYLHDPADVTGALAEERRLRETLLRELSDALVRRLAANG
ncbi:MAG TPA: LPS assembly lipoprotein LptE [Gammaproteobacteria bacterium]